MMNYKTIVKEAKINDRFILAASELAGKYPYNLLIEIFGDFNAAISANVAGLTDAIETLDAREQEVLYGRFVRLETLEALGKTLGVQKERVRQIEAKALRKLRHPSRANKVQCILKSDYLREYEECCRLKVALNKITSGIESVSQEDLENLKLPTMLMSVAEANFSVRTYNCLIRAGFKTLESITNLTYNDLFQIRNLGKHSAEEVVQKLASYGLSLKEEPDPEKPKPSHISVPLQNGINIVAEIGSDKDFNEVYVGLEDDKGSWVQDLVVVGEKYDVGEDLEKKHIDDKVRILVYGDVYNEDYTNYFEVDVWKDIEETEE